MLSLLTLLYAINTGWEYVQPLEGILSPHTTLVDALYAPLLMAELHARVLDLVHSLL
jgi:hypothetical protein